MKRTSMLTYTISKTLKHSPLFISPKSFDNSLALSCRKFECVGMYLRYFSHI